MEVLQNLDLRLRVKNFRAVGNAEISLNGITVLTGENGCGKSTISKLLYRVVTSSVCLEEHQNLEYLNFIEDSNKRLEFFSKELTFAFPELREALRAPFKNLKSNEFSLDLFGNTPLEERLHQVIDYYLSKVDIINNFVAQANEAQMSRVFRAQRSLVRDFEPGPLPIDVDGVLQTFKSKILEYKLDNQRHVEDRPLDLLISDLYTDFEDLSLIEKIELFEAGVPIVDSYYWKIQPMQGVSSMIYIDTPMSLGLETDYPGHWTHLNELLRDNSRKQFSSEFIKEINDNVIKGEVKSPSPDSFQYDFLYERKDGEVFNILDCATGIKSFGILQLLLKRGYLHNQTLLIIDEPEVHLHPQWVVEYARLLVLLNKKLGVRFFLSSHSPDMVSALKYISESEGISSNVNFYLAQIQEENSFKYLYKPLAQDIEPIFESFNIAMDRIELYGRT